jgi:hypothetical protein
MSEHVAISVHDDVPPAEGAIVDDGLGISNARAHNRRLSDVARAFIDESEPLPGLMA